MSEQAIETTDEIETTETEVEEVEIVVEGEEQPTSTAPKGDFYKRVKKLSGKIETANQEADEQRRRAEAAEEETKLWRLKAEQTTLKRPKQDDFESDVEYDKALDEYEDQRTAAAVQKQTAKLISDSQTTTSLASQNRNLETNLKAHYERAGELKVTDYEETEDKAIEVLGNDLAKQIMANSKNSHLLMYHFGKNLSKAGDIANLVASDPLKGVLEIGGLESSLKVQPKHSTAPDPPSIVEGGTVSSDWQKRIDKAREEAQVTGDVKKLFELKKQAKEAGATIG